MRVGKVIREIRLSKKLKVKNVYNNILERPSVSKFEKGISDTTSEKFFKILDNLNISLEEFFFRYNQNNESEDFDFLQNYTKFFYDDDVNSLRKLENEMYQKYKQYQQDKLLYYSILANLTISSISKEALDEQKLKILTEYLFRCEDWNYFEIILFTNSMDFFSKDTILLLYKRLRDKLEEFKQIRKYNNELFVLVNNILVIFLIANDLNTSKKLYSDLKQYMSNTNNKMYEKTMLIFFKELIDMISKKTSNSSPIEEIINFFDFLNMPNKKNQCIQLVEVIKVNNNLN